MRQSDRYFAQKCLISQQKTLIFRLSGKIGVLYFPRHNQYDCALPMPKSAEKEPKNFEAAMAELDLLVEKMEAGQLPLEESLAAYQRGTELLKYCEKVLSDAEQRIQQLAPAANGEAAKLEDFSE
jgi:exodeoxyribonuclease VII small subunit